jgi:hypothetical protein
VVLAVTLALMALVTAASTGRQIRSGAPPLEVAKSGRPSTSATTTPRPAVTTSTNHAVSPVIEQTASRQPPVTSTSAPSTTTTAATATTTTTTAGSGTGNSPMQSAAKNDQGFLEPPGDTAAIYTFNGTGLTTVSVTWTPEVGLTLTATCTNGTQSGEGDSSLDMTLPNAEGSCQLTLSEPAGETADVTFSLTITPAANG